MKKSTRTPHPGPDIGSPKARKYLFLGLGLTGLYAVVALMFDNFALPCGVDYAPPRTAKYDLGIEPRLVKELSAHALVSILAKALLLAPACAAFAFYLARVIPSKPVEAIAGWVHGQKARAILTAVVLVSAGVMVFWSQSVFMGQPVYDDEWTYLFQAQIIQGGQLAAPAPPCPDCFKNVFIIIRDGIWTGKYTSGHPALLALSMFAGSPYLITILLASLVPFLVFLIARDLHGIGLGLLTAALFVVSPFFLMVSSTLMNHGTCLFFLAAFTLGFLRSRDGLSWIYAVLAGLAMGAAFNIRPQSAVAYGLPFVVWALVRIVGPDRRLFLGRYVAMLGAFIPLAWLAFYYNAVVSGQWYTFPFMLAEPEVPGAVSFFTLGDQTVLGHTVWKGIYFSLLNLWRLNHYLFGWGVSLVFVVMVFLWGLNGRVDRLWWGVIACTVTVYLFFASPGVLEAGPRYFFPLLIPVMIWTARGMQAVHGRFANRFRGHPLCGRTLVPAFVSLSVVMSAATFGAEQIRHYRRLVPAVARPYETVAEADVHHAIVALMNLPACGWVYGLRNNHPDLASNDVIYVWGNGPKKMLCLMDHFVGRSVFLLYFERKGQEVRPRLVPATRETFAEAMDRR